MVANELQSNDALRSLIEAVPGPAMYIEASGRVLHANRAAISEWPSRLGAGEPLDVHDYEGSIFYPDGTPMPIEDSPFAITIREGRECRDVEVEVRLPGQNAHYLRVSTTPLSAGEKVIGAFVMAQPLNELISARSLLEQRNQALQALNALAARLLQMNTTQEIYNAALDGILAAMGAAKGGLVLADDDKREFRLVAHRNYGEETQRSLTHLSYDVPSAHNEARRTGEIVVIHPGQMQQPAGGVLSREHMQTAVLLPLIIGERVGAVLSYLLEQHSESTPLHHEILRTAASHASAALQRAQLYERAEGERARLEQALKSMPSGVIIAEAPGGRLVMGNAQVAKIWRHPFVQSSGIDEYVEYKGFHPDGRPYAPEDWPLARAISSGEEINGEEIEIERGDGTPGYISVNASPIRNQNGEIEAAIVTFTDVSERKSLEKQVNRHTEDLKSEYERLATLIGNLSIALSMTDEKGRLVVVNDAWLKRTNFTREQVIGHRHEEFVDASFGKGIQEIIDSVLASGEPLILKEQHYYDPETNSHFYIDGSILPIRGQDGRLTGAMTVSIDVTEKVLARQKVEEQRSLLEAVFDTAPVGIVLYDREMRIANFNAESRKMSSFFTDDMRGENLYEHAPAALERKPFHDRVLTGEEIDLNNVSYALFGGEVRYYDIRYRPLRDEKGEITGLLATNTDVTERALSHQELASQKALLEAIVQSAPVGIALFDRDMRFANLNQQYADYTGRSVEDFMGKIIYDTNPNAAARMPIHRRVLAGEDVDESNLAYPDDSGQMHYYDVRYRPVRSADGEVTGVVSTVVDVTERRLQEVQKDEFIALASHELKTPITAIKGYAQVLLHMARKNGDERTARSLSVINEKADRLTRLINELLDVTRVENGTLALFKERFDLGALLKDVISSLELTAPEFHIAVDVPDEPVEVEADRQRVEEVVTNLILNAIKYSGESRRVEMTMHREGNEAVTAIRDFGVGIPMSQQEQVFERFFRASNVSSPRYSGLGLGLFISHSIIERHGSRIWLESTENKGSVFTFTLPLAVPPASAESPESAESLRED